MFPGFRRNKILIFSALDVVFRARMKKPEEKKCLRDPYPTANDFKFCSLLSFPPVKVNSGKNVTAPRGEQTARGIKNGTTHINAV
jgi:hypothetical protein